MSLIEPKQIIILIVTDFRGRVYASRKLVEAEDPCDFDYRVEQEMITLMNAYPHCSLNVDTE